MAPEVRHKVVVVSRFVLIERGQQAVLEEVAASIFLLGQNTPEGHVQDLPGIIVLKQRRQLAVGEIHTRRNPSSTADTW